MNKKTASRLVCFRRRYEKLKRIGTLVVMILHAVFLLLKIWTLIMG